MITYGGTRIYPTNIEGPPISLFDIAQSLGRLPRYAGHTNHWWSVLHHSLTAERVAFEMGFPPRIRLLMLLHDAHECVTGDIPSTWKPTGIKDAQEGLLDPYIFASLGVPEMLETEKRFVRDIDLIMLGAEARIMKPVPQHQYFPAGTPLAIAEVDDMHNNHPTALSSCEGWHSPLVRLYCGRVRAFLGQKGATVVEEYVPDEDVFG